MLTLQPMIMFHAYSSFSFGTVPLKPNNGLAIKLEGCRLLVLKATFARATLSAQHGPRT